MNKSKSLAHATAKKKAVHSNASLVWRFELFVAHPTPAQGRVTSRSETGVGAESDASWVALCVFRGA